MIRVTIHTQATEEAIRRALELVPQEAKGDGQAAHDMRLRMGLALLGCIKQAFIVKARGGTDDAGDRWAPLKPSTIAYSRTRSRGRGGRTGSERSRGSRPSQALSTAQQERWWRLYRQGLAIYNGDKGNAARRAWGIMKSEGVSTLVSKYGNRPVEILRDTGALLNSLSPGAPSADQVLSVAPGSVTVGTNRKWAAAHHNGVPGRIPQRRLWPPVERWPAGWWADILAEAQAGVLRIIGRLAARAHA